MTSQPITDHRSPVTNPSTLWATLFVDELARAGLRTAVIAPGSRSTPLTLAFAAHPDIHVVSLLDERSAAFYALGIGLASGQPAALVCTSGTAAANFYPAIIEANYAHVPLLVLTADRPPEIRESGANQTVDQLKMYGHQVRWFVDVAVPENRPAPHTLRYLRSLAGRAVAATMGLPPGPVQLNFPFRKPLEPVPHPGFEPPAETARSARTPFARVTRGRVHPTPDQLADLTGAIVHAQRGIIVCGPRCPGGEFPARVVELARVTGFPLFADALSGVRFGPHTGNAPILAGYETFLPALTRAGLASPDVVLHFGAPPISAKLNDWLATLPATTRRFAIRESGDWQDDAYTTSDFVWADPEIVCETLLSSLNSHKFSPTPSWLSLFQSAESQTWQTIESVKRETWFEGAILADVAELMPPDGLLFSASSLPVRHLDQFAAPRAGGIRPFANRGASGIDGTISTALGVASVADQPLVLVIGDLAFYHDLNGLLAFQRAGVKVTIVLINNNGGGIFWRLPIAQFDPPFTDLFLTPHGLDFEPLVRSFGVGYTRADGREEFRKIFAASVRAGMPVVIEVQTDSELQEVTRRQIASLVQIPYLSTALDTNIFKS
ncbi:MAG: 2-succinyl-5-enolpyruvyl-6-hydroxy-3-cyclohexene-1-carboxylic-acid synthase [Anaerolineales bacterium]